ncbi:MAG: hypothetical protein E7473_10390 [Ruminococcaceae bacterium]|nr:hypothetical protein [Oscillospiraceae bacterium]
MAFFDFFKKQNSVQENQYICDCCKDMVPERNLKWVGARRLCEKCVARELGKEKVNETITGTSSKFLYELFIASENVNPVSDFQYVFYIDVRNGQLYLSHSEILMYEDVYDQIKKDFRKISYSELFGYIYKLNKGKEFLGMNERSWKEYVIKAQEREKREKADLRRNIGKAGCNVTYGKKKTTERKDSADKDVNVDEKKYICARCKKEITESESKVIGVHRFCKKCAGPTQGKKNVKMLCELRTTPMPEKTNVAKTATANKYTFSNNSYPIPHEITWISGSKEIQEFRRRLHEATSIDEIRGKMLSFSCCDKVEEILIEKLADEYSYIGERGGGGDTTKIEWSFISKDEKRLLTITAISHRGGPFLFGTEWKDIILKSPEREMNAYAEKKTSKKASKENDSDNKDVNVDEKKREEKIKERSQNTNAAPAAHSTNKEITFSKNDVKTSVLQACDSNIYKTHEEQKKIRASERVEVTGGRLMKMLDITTVNLSDLDIILEKWQKNTGILLPGYKIDKIKKEIVSAVEFIKQDKKDNTIMDFYYSEYPMGAIHRKGVRKENGGWLLFQYDYDKKPSYREVPLSADDFIETFILFEHQNG